MLWLIPTVFLSSLVGVSQTAHAIPRILRQLSDETNERGLLHSKGLVGSGRKFNDGIFLVTTSIIPTSFQSDGNPKVNGTNLHARFRFLLKYYSSILGPGSKMFPFIVITLGFLIAFIAAYRVPQLALNVAMSGCCLCISLRYSVGSSVAHWGYWGSV